MSIKDSIFNLFTDHPNKNNMNYYQHFMRAMNLSLKMGLGSFYLFMHSIFPFMFENNGSKIINSLHKDIKSE